MSRSEEASRGERPRGAFSSAGFTVVGGGIVGLATARALLGRNEGPMRLLEKETTLAQHQSSHNSGVLHAGLQYRPGSEKARRSREGIRRMTEFCRAHRIAHEICGKLVVATSDDELPRLDAMLSRGRQNGLKGLRRLDPAEATEIEPHVECRAAIHVPEEGIADFGGVCAALAEELRTGGCEIVTGAEVLELHRERGGWRIVTTAGEFATRILVNCAGLHSDRVARMAGTPPPCRIIPFRGEYHRLRAHREHLVRHLIYPLPEPGFPFLGVHFTRRIGGGVDAGPNAVLAFAREGYALTTFDLRDLADVLSYEGFWRFGLRHPRTVLRELGQSVDRRRFLRALRRMVPEIRSGDLQAGPSGVRAQAVLPDGSFVHDFLWIDGPRAVHVLNAPSPAATAALAIGDAVARRAVERGDD